MPFLRLILIYIVVIGLAVAFFNRGKVMELAGIGFDNSKAAEVEEAEEAMPVAAEVAEEPQEDVATAAPVKEPTAKTPVAPEAGLAEELDKTRKAFWNGDTQNAEKLYVALAEKYESNANIQGETGNFFFAQRRFEEAARYFHNAGLLLIENGNTQQITSIINALQGIAPDKAADLRARAAQQP